MINNLEKSIITFLFGLITSAYLWIRNEKSDHWIVIFFSVILANKLLDIGHELTINDFNINNYLSIVGYILFLIHPLVNLIGAYTQIDGGLRIEPVILSLSFLIYKLFINPVPLDIIRTKTDKGYIYNFANFLNKYELTAYLILLLFPMIVYDPPKNIVMIFGTLFTLFIAYILNKKKLDRSITDWHTYITALLGLNVLFL